MLDFAKLAGVPKFYDLMLDIETAGKGTDAALLSIGAVFFHLPTQTLGPTFNQTIHLATSVKHGGTMDPATFLWWLGQSEEARNGVRYNGRDIVLVLNEFRDFIQGVTRLEDVRVWGNSPAFDCVIVRTAYERLGLKAPWHFTNEYCFRTIRNVYHQVEYDPGEKGTGNHNALADAIFQAEHLFKIRNRHKDQ